MHCTSDLLACSRHHDSGNTHLHIQKGYAKPPENHERIWTAIFGGRETRITTWPI